MRNSPAFVNPFDHPEAEVPQQRFFGVPLVQQGTPLKHNFDERQDEDCSHTAQDTDFNGIACDRGCARLSPVSPEILFAQIARSTIRRITTNNGSGSARAYGTSFSVSSS